VDSQNTTNRPLLVFLMVCAIICTKTAFLLSSLQFAVMCNSVSKAHSFD
jgi:hypothetical protein